MQVPVHAEAGTKIEPPPCFRCLFEKPISDGWCHPETCEMLDFWLLDNDFSWAKYASEWALKLEYQNSAKSEPSEEEETFDSNFL